MSYEAACQGGAVLGSPLLELLDGGACHWFGQLLNVHAEACCEGFGQHYKVGLSLQLFQAEVEAAQVFELVFPGNVGLYQGDAHGR